MGSISPRMIIALLLAVSGCGFERPADVGDDGGSSDGADPTGDGGHDSSTPDAPAIDAPLACTMEGATQLCGTTAEGECSLGIETCTSGSWAGCTAVGPTAEICNGLDDNCADGVPAGENNTDGDPARLCQGDCDDTRSDVFPGAPELCDGRDNDCANGIPTNENNADGDAFRICQGDCNDSNATIHPAAFEACNGLDDNCNGAVPANETNADGDAFRICDGDCNDSNPNIHPAATEVCNDIDDNCANGKDEGTFGFCNLGACPGTQFCISGQLICSNDDPNCDPACGVCGGNGCCVGNVCVNPCP